MALGGVTTGIYTYLNASRFLIGQAWLAGAQVMIALTLAWMFAGRWGSAGVALGLALGYLFVIVPAQAVIVPRILASQRMNG